MERGNKLYFSFMEIIKKNTMLKNAEPGNTYLVELSGDGSTLRSVIPEIDAKSSLFMMPGTGMQAWDNSLIYSVMSLNFKDYAVEKIVVE